LQEIQRAALRLDAAETGLEYLPLPPRQSATGQGLPSISEGNAPADFWEPVVTARCEYTAS